jgi:putative heme-binding domain-containing protein
MRILIALVTFAACSAIAADPPMSSIFNGKDLTGWQKPKYPECWTVQDGMLVVKNNPRQKGENLNTVKHYRDFICQVEFKFGEGTIDSGIFLRNNKEQIQVGISGSLKRDMTASPYIPGKGYPVEAKGVKELLKLDDWNTLRIRALGNVYTSWLNGKEVMNYTSSSAAQEGPLGIQLHGSRTMTVFYRNLQVGEIAPATGKAEAPAAAPKNKGASTLPAGAGIKKLSFSSEQDGNPAMAAFDDNAGSRWSANGDGEWLAVELEKPVALSKIGLGFQRVSEGRRYKFIVEGSTDGKTWQQLYKGESSVKGERDVETFALKAATVSHLRITSHGSNKNSWVNLHSVQIPGVNTDKISKSAQASAPAVAKGKSTTAAAGGLTVELWAENPLIASPLGISFDNQGRAYVTRVRRRKQSSIDIRGHRDWVKHDLKIQSIDDRLEFYKKALGPKQYHGVRMKPPPDRNGDGQRDLNDLSQREEVRMLVDSDADGKADKHYIIDDDLATPVTGIAAGMLWTEGVLYAAVEPNIHKYTDSDGDGVVDKRETISTGYSVHIGQGGHNMSGLAIGFDGRIYWSVGDKGINATGPDGARIVLPNRGGVMRCEPDGSKLECFAPGVRNGQELAFDEFGNMFTVDNDGDYKGERERFLYLIEGGEIGWRLNWQWFKMQDFAKVSGEAPYNVWMEENLFKTRFDGQAAYIVPPCANYSNGPCGFKYNPGTALNESYRNHFFLAQGKSLHAFKVEPEGGRFKMVGEHKISGGPHNTGLAFSPDGALFLCDWMNGPSERGRIWRVDDKSQVANALRLETKGILEAGMTKRSIAELTKLLSHADMRVRRNAQFELVRRDDAGYQALLASVKQTEHRLQRLHGIWGIGQLARKTPAKSEPLLPYLTDSDLEVRAHVATVLGDTPLISAAPQLIKLLKDPEIRVQSHAAIALGKLKSADAVGPLFAALAENADKDAYLRHALVMGLTTADSAKLAAASGHESSAVRLGAVLALRRQAHGGIAFFVKDTDPYIVTEAALAIHDDFSIPAALPALAEALDRTDVPGEPFLRRAINANFRVGRAEDAARLARYAARKDTPENMRTTALACLALWPQPPVLDAVEGRYREYAPRDPGPAAKALGGVADELVALGSSKVMTVLAQAIQRLNSVELLPLVHAMYDAKGASTKLRSQLLDTMKTLSDPELGAFVQRALKDNDNKLRAAAQKYAAAAGVSGVELAKRALAGGSLTEKRAALKNLANSADSKAAALLSAEFANLEAGETDKAIALDVLEAASASAALKDKAAAFAGKHNGGFALALHGGDSSAGKDLAFGHPAAQCIRCHKVGVDGGELGPDLSKVAGRLSREKLLESIVDPAAELAEGFGLLIATLKDGKIVSGTLVGKTDTVYTVKTGEGKEIKVDRKSIKTEQMTSSMPPMNAILKPREVRDLVEYLSGLK